MYPQHLVVRSPITSTRERIQTIQILAVLCHLVDLIVEVR